jgi:aldehyde:ferredoxin oxidoreductase
MNAANGFSQTHDDLPPRFFEPPAHADSTPGSGPIKREAFLAARADYYLVRGLDPQGRPREDKARQLGLRTDRLARGNG